MAGTTRVPVAFVVEGLSYPEAPSTDARVMREGVCRQVYRCQYARDPPRGLGWYNPLKWVVAQDDVIAAVRAAGHMQQAAPSVAAKRSRGT